MLTLSIQVPEARDRTALATLIRHNKKIAEGFAAASASPKIAAARGNPECDPLRAWGHPPLGTYRLINHQPSGKDYAGEYGMHLLLFEPMSGPALQAQAAGRVGLLVYAGPAGQDKCMRRTQGGLRLSNGMLGTLAGQMGDMSGVTLTIESLRKPPWWKFWASTPGSPPLSSSAIKAYAAPLDEMSIILKLMNGARRNFAGGASDDRREPERSRDDNNDRWDNRSSNRSDSDTFRGGGGESAGAGASGSWDSAGSTARGVDASGRIVAGIAVGAAAAAVAASAAARNSDDTTTLSAIDGSTGGSGDTRFESSGESSGSSGSNAQVTTSTSY